MKTHAVDLDKTLAFHHSGMGIRVIGKPIPSMMKKVKNWIAEGDKVVSRLTARGTQQGELMGMPPTGKTVRTPAIQIFRFSNGKIVESWAARDDLGTLRQLGQLPAPSGAAKR